MKTILKRTVLIALSLLMIVAAAACTGETGGDNSKGSSSKAAVSRKTTSNESEASDMASSEETASQSPVNTTPQPDTVTYRAASANAQVKNLKVVFAGDSLTEGDGTYSGYRYQAWRALYAAGITYETVGPYMSERPDERLPARYRKYGGKCGWKISNLYDKREEVFRDDFDVVFMMIGYNDGNAAYADVNINLYRQILDYIYSRNAKAVVFAMGVAPSDYNVGQKTTFKHAPFNVKVEAICKEYASVGKKMYYVDTWDSDEWSKEACFSDSVHFNETGNRVLASTLAKVAVPVLKQMNTPDPSYTLPTAPTGITLDKNSVSVVAHSTFGEGIQLNATVTPSNAQVPHVVWGSSDRRIATVDENGVVRGVSAGTCTVTAYTFNGGIAATCTVTVTDKKGDTLAFNDKLDNYAANWTGGKADYFSNGYKYRKYNYTKEAEPEVSKATVTTGKNFYLATSVRSWAASSASAEGTLDISVGGVTLRVNGRCVGAAVLVDGKVVCEWSNGKPILERTEFGVMIENGKVTLMRDGAPVATGTCAAKSFSGNVTMFNQLPYKTMIRFIRLSTW